MHDAFVLFKVNVPIKERDFSKGRSFAESFLPALGLGCLCGAPDMMHPAKSSVLDNQGDSDNDARRSRLDVEYGTTHIEHM